MDTPATGGQKSESPGAGGADAGDAGLAYGHGIGWREFLKVWSRVALLSFGGPAGQIAVMHRILVEEKKWISESRFLHALNYCMLLPGPEATQLATYIGWLIHRTAGGIASGVLFILPGIVALLALSYVYAGWGNVGIVAAVFYGLKPAVLALVVEAVVRIGKRALKTRLLIGLAASAFVAIYFFAVPFPVIIFSAGLIGWLGGKYWPSQFPGTGGHAATGGAPAQEAATVDAWVERTQPAHLRPNAWRALRVLCICLILWFGPLLALLAFLPLDNVFVQEGLFFSQAAVVTFGGAYSVLAYLAQQAVERYHWLSAGQMLDGLGMAETTPGPLIMVVQFVGFMGGYNNPGLLHPMLAGTLAALLSTWVTFVPCFLWIFLGAPYIESLRNNRALTHALTGITASVVGVILNLAVWFSLHTLYATVNERQFGPLRLFVPLWATADIVLVVLAAAALYVMLRWKWGMAYTLGACAVLGMAAWYTKAGMGI